MPCRYTINPEARVVSAEYYGTLELADVRKNQSEMRADPGFDPSFNYLVDLRGVQTMGLSSMDMQTASQESFFNDNIKVAVVAATDLHFGMSRVFEMSHDKREKTVKVFRDADDARRWIGLDVD